MKAMAHDPEDRYATARALADDIDLWLADLPVTAYAERPIERLGRWLRRHRTLTFAAAALLIGISLAATVGAIVIEGGRRREEIARKEAQTNFVMAQDAVKDYLTSVSENTLLKQQDSVDIRGLRRELLNTALKYYKNFVGQRSRDPNLREQLANAYFRVGEITQEIDSRVEAIEAFQQAQTIWQSLAAADPANHELQGRVADCHLAIGKLTSAAGDLKGALFSFEQARQILEPLAARHLDLARIQTRLAKCYSEIGAALGTLRSGDQGLESLQKAREIQQGLVVRYPEDISYRQRLAETINILGFVYSKRLDNANAIRCFQECLTICRTLLEQAKAGPKPVRLLGVLALAHYNIATVHISNRQFELALLSLNESIKYRSELAAQHPSVTKFHENLGESYEVIADLQHKAHQDDKAFSSLQKAIEILEKLVRSHPSLARLHGWLGRSYNTLGFLHDELRQNLQAIPAFLKAVNEQRSAVAQSPDDGDYQALLGNHLENLGEQHVDLGEVETGLPFYLQGVQVRRQLLTSHPENREYLLDLANALCTLGNVEHHAGNSAGARALFFDARAC